MRLKIFVVPFAIIMLLIVTIGYIKPDIATLEEKQVMLETKTEQSQNVTTLLSNISSLESSLDGQPATENAVRDFIPQGIDQERVIDMFNYLASQAGLYVSVMDIREVQMKNDTESVSVDPALDAAGTIAAASAVTSPLKPKLQAYSAAVTVKGSYESVRDFFNQLAHMNRFHKISNFTLEVGEADSDDSKTGTLTGVFLAQFDYFPRQKIDSALNVPIFSRDSFDKEKLSALLKWITYPVSPLKAEQSGRPNPFQ